MVASLSNIQDMFGANVPPTTHTAFHDHAQGRQEHEPLAREVAAGVFVGCVGCDDRTTLGAEAQCRLRPLQCRTQAPVSPAAACA
eukprot:2154563-Rhodomonas_salina.1